MALFGKFASLYVQVTLANVASNTILHPHQRLDYGILNKYKGDAVGNKWWGTRLEHLLVIPLTIATTDLGLQALWKKVLKRELTWKSNPKLLLFHFWAFAASGIMLFTAQHCLLSPTLASRKDRWENFKHYFKPTVVGAGLQWHFPHVHEWLIKATGGNAAGPVGWLCFTGAATAAFTAVKAGGFGDYGRAGLSPFERKLNKLD